MLQVQGRSDLFLRLEIIKKCIAVIPLLMGVFIGIYWMLIGSVISGICSLYLNAYYSGPYLKYSIWEQTRDILPSLLMSLAMFVILLLPSTAPLIGCLMLGNLWKVCGVTERLSDTVQNALMNIVTVFLGISVGATTVAANFLSLRALFIIILGLTAFCFSTVGGLLVGKLMYKLSGGKINPLIGSAGVSAVPMAARVSQMEGQKANPTNFLLMHAMGPNVAGVIGSAIAAGFLLAVFK